MNDLGPGLIDPVTLASVRADIVSIVEDPEMYPRLATLYSPTADGETFDLASGAYTRNESQDTVAGQMGALTWQERQGWEQAEAALQVAISSVTVEPTTATRVAIGADTYEVLNVDRDPLNIFYRLLLRRRKGA